MHTLGCAAGYNLRWLLRAIARLGIRALFLRLLQAALAKQGSTQASYATLGGVWVTSVRRWFAAGVIKKAIFGHAAPAAF